VPQPQALVGFRVAALVDDRFEQVELTGPKQAFEAAGAKVDVVSRLPRLQAMHHTELGDHFARDVDLAAAEPGTYDALLLPGGVINGDSLRAVPDAQRFARAFAEHDKPIAVICHGGWLLLSAGVVRNRTLTSWPSLQDDYRNAGAHWKDQEVVVDGNWISSRKPADIPAFAQAAIDVFARARQKRAA
jgi:protease I